MTDYKGVVYVIESSQDPEHVYIGSTKNGLKRRFSSHRTRGKNCAHPELTEWIHEMNASIRCLEEYPCKDNLELYKRERDYMEMFVDKGFKLLNRRITEELALKQSLPEDRQRIKELRRIERALTWTQRNARTAVFELEAMVKRIEWTYWDGWYILTDLHKLTKRHPQ